MLVDTSKGNTCWLETKSATFASRFSRLSPPLFLTISPRKCVAICETFLTLPPPPTRLLLHPKLQLYASFPRYLTSNRSIKRCCNIVSTEICIRASTRDALPRKIVSIQGQNNPSPPSRMDRAYIHVFQNFSTDKRTFRIFHDISRNLEIIIIITRFENSASHHFVKSSPARAAVYIRDTNLEAGLYEREQEEEKRPFSWLDFEEN